MPGGDLLLASLDPALCESLRGEARNLGKRSAGKGDLNSEGAITLDDQTVRGSGVRMIHHG